MFNQKVFYFSTTMNKRYTAIKLTLALPVFLLVLLKPFAQSIPQHSINDAYAITRLVDNFHIQARAVNDTFSRNVFDLLLKKLDERKIYFTQEDITILKPYRDLLDDAILTKNPKFIQLLSTIYRQRVKQTDSLINEIGKKPFNFSLKEKLTASEDTNYAANIAALSVKLYKTMKLATAHSIIEDYPRKATAAVQKKYTDSIEPIIRAHIAVSIKRSFNTLLDKENGIENKIGNAFCECVANCFDPHTDYFPKEEKEEFETHLGKKPLVFGFSIVDEEDGGVKIESLEPGSPAYKSGQINKGDRIVAIQCEGKEKVTVGDKGVVFVSDLLDDNNTEKATITVKKADGTTKQVSLQKERVDNGEDDDRVKSFVLKGAKTIGYVSLPAFYVDWDEKDNGNNGCANDVAKEIIKLKEEHIDGLMIDVRFNGGGSVREAIELAGIFIDAGPVALVKEKEGKTQILKDLNRGTIYDGPLAIMVNGESASASELFAGTLQDYHRAIVVGSPTFGKATGQVVLPLDTTINKKDNLKDVKADSYLKITDWALFRVSGKTAQCSGVEPDIVLPDLLSVKLQREVDDPLALHFKPIDANKYYQPFTPTNIAPLKFIADSAVNNWKDFAVIKEDIKAAMIAKQKKDKSLLLADVLALKAKDLDDDDDDIVLTDTTESETKEKDNGLFTVANHAYETKRLMADASQKETNEEWKGFVINDPYIKTVYKVLVAMASK